MSETFFFDSGTNRDLVIQAARAKLWNINLSGYVCTDPLKFPYENFDQAVAACVEESWYLETTR